MPRHYNLGKRALEKDATKGRIIQAAVDLYGERGMSRTSMQQIATRADVAPATVFNHFASREELDAAIVERALAEMAAPDAEIYDGLTTLRERIARLSRETGAFIDRAGTWYRMWLREPMTSGDWAAAGADYGARWDRLFRAALGPLADDARAMAVLRAVMNPPFIDSVRAGTRSTEEAADLIAAAITPWLEQLAGAETPGVGSTG
jgi:AcrR family transcriptional regulator